MDRTKAKGAQHLLQLKLILRYIKPPIWRRIVVPDDFTLGDLHYIIQRAMGWFDGHMHEFRVPARGFGPPLRRLGRIEKGLDYEGEDEEKVQVGEILTVKGKVLLYEYDFGDGWLHEIKLEKTLPLDSSGTYPICLAGERACPPEDCGGVPGYYRVLEAVKVPKAAKNREPLNWVGQFDPEAFDLEAVNKRLGH